MFLDLSPFRHKNFRRLFFGQLISAFGTQMTAVVVPFQIYFITKSTLYTGLISAVEFIFILFSSLIGGVLADRFEKRKLLIWSEICLSLAPLALALNSLSEMPNLWVIFILAAFNSFLVGLHRPALESLTPRLVPQDEIAKISALSPMRYILTTILSPMIGGFAMISLGAFYTYLFDAISFFISLVFLLGVDYKQLTSSLEVKSKSILGEIIEGYHYIKSRKENGLQLCKRFYCHGALQSGSPIPSTSSSFPTRTICWDAICIPLYWSFFDDFDISLDTFPHKIWSLHCLCRWALDSLPNHCGFSS